MILPVPTYDIHMASAAKEFIFHLQRQCQTVQRIARIKKTKVGTWHLKPEDLSASFGTTKIVH